MADDRPTFDEARAGHAAEEHGEALRAEDRHRSSGPNVDAYVEMDGLPDEAWSQVTDGLWVGGMREWGAATPAELTDFGAVWTFDERPLRADGNPPGGHVWTFPDQLQVPDLEQLTEVALDVWAAATSGQDTLVRCWAGLNRSSLFAVSALVLGGGADPRRAIERVRARRHHGALNNPAYVDLLLGLEGPHPDAAPVGPVDPAAGLR